MPRKQMGPAEITGIVLFALLVFIGVYDVWASYTLGRSATVSYVVQSWAIQFPILGVLIGIILGHLFWPVGPIAGHDGAPGPQKSP